jgi:Tfp pilus assembly protein PilF
MLQVAPADAERHYQVAKYWLGQQRTTEALISLDRAIRLDPTHAEALNARASVKASQADFSGARLDLDQALAAKSERSHLHYNSGVLHRMMGYPEAARAAFERALRLQPDHPEALMAMAALGSSLGEAKVTQPVESSNHSSLVRIPDSASEPSQTFSLERLRESAAKTARGTLDVIRAEAQSQKGDSKGGVVASEAALPAAPNATGRIAGQAPAVVPGPSEALNSSLMVRRLVDEVPVQDLEAPEPLVIKAAASSEMGESTVLLISKPRTELPSFRELRVIGATLEVVTTTVGSPSVIAIAPTTVDSARIDVANGNGINGMARALRGQLRGIGVQVATISNWGNFNQPVTRVLYRDGYEQAARELADRLPVQAELVAVARLPRTDRDVVVVLGRDMRGYRATVSGWESMPHLSDVSAA